MAEVFNGVETWWSRWTLKLGTGMATETKVQPLTNILAPFWTEIHNTYMW